MNHIPEHACYKCIAGLLERIVRETARYERSRQWHLPQKPDEHIGGADLEANLGTLCRAIIFPHDLQVGESDQLSPNSGFGHIFLFDFFIEMHPRLSTDTDRHEKYASRRGGQKGLTAFEA